MIWFWRNRDALSYSLNSFYKAIGISRQGVHDMLNRMQRNLEIEASMTQMIRMIREDHPTMSLRSMYYKIQPTAMGRDRFEAMCVSYGYQVQSPANYKRTTNSNGVIRFPNRLEGLTVSHKNQVWVSDITYFEIANKYYYITLILDAYSRFIKGYHASRSMETLDTTVPALQMALKAKGLPRGIIMHSDGGGQYYSKAFLKITAKAGMENSMAKEAYENPQAERINGTIKNNYLRHWAIHTFTHLEKALDRAVVLYNFEKPHKSLHYLTPAQIEHSNYLYEEQTTNSKELFKGKKRSVGVFKPQLFKKAPSEPETNMVKLETTS